MSCLSFLFLFEMLTSCSVMDFVGYQYKPSEKRQRADEDEIDVETEEDESE